MCLMLHQFAKDKNESKMCVKIQMRWSPVQGGSYSHSYSFFIHFTSCMHASCLILNMVNMIFEQRAL